MDSQTPLRYCVGIFGGMGCGKSTVSAILRGLGARVLDADKVNASLSHDPTYLSEVRALCPDCLSTGDLDRSALRRWVLASDQNRRALMAVAHPLIADRIIRETQTGLWFVEFSVYVPDLVPLDESWHVVCGRQMQIQRILARGGWTEQEARVLIEAQLADGMAPMDAIVIDNDGTPDMLRSQVACLYRKVQDVHK